MTNERMFINYDDGGIQGYVAFDDITFGNSLKISNQSFISITNTDGNMVNSPGIIGLGQKSLATNSRYPYFLENLLNT